MDRLLLKNALIATDSEVFPGAVLVNGETIAEVYRKEYPPGGLDARVIDAGGCYLLPGGVDAHTHFDMDAGFTRSSDTFFTGTVAAACGGTTTIIDHMAFGPEGCALPHQSGVYRRLALRSVVDYGFHGVIQHVDEGVLADMKALRDLEGLSSFKFYLAYDYSLDDAQALRVLRRAKELGVTVCVHCEDGAMIAGHEARYSSEGRLSPGDHAASRPPEAEAEAVARILRLAKEAGEAKIYIVHLSSAAGLHAIKEARAAGQGNILVETCPQYLLLFDSLYDDEREGLKFIISPPLRKEWDARMLWNGLTAGDIQTIGTDHCPFFFDPQKLRGLGDFTRCPNGMPGVEMRMPLMFSEGFMKNRLSLPRVVDLCCTRPAEIFGLGGKKGVITRGADADLVLYDPGLRWRVAKAELHENVDYTPYEGMELAGRPVMTICRGRIIAENNAFLGEEGRGRYLYRR